MDWSLAKVFEKEIQFYRQFERYRQEINFRVDFEIPDAFVTIDQFNKKFVDNDSLYIFLKRWNRMINEDDIIAIFRRVDLDNDGKISYNEFIESILPSTVPHTVNYHHNSTPVRSRSPVPNRKVNSPKRA